MKEICEKSALQWVAQQIWLRNMRALRVWSRFAVKPKQYGGKNEMRTSAKYLDEIPREFCKY